MVNNTIANSYSTILNRFLTFSSFMVLVKINKDYCNDYTNLIVSLLITAEESAVS